MVIKKKYPYPNEKEFIDFIWFLKSMGITITSFVVYYRKKGLSNNVREYLMNFNALTHNGKSIKITYESIDKKYGEKPYNRHWHHNGNVFNSNPRHVISLMKRHLGRGRDLDQLIRNTVLEVNPTLNYTVKLV